VQMDTAVLPAKTANNSYAAGAKQSFTASSTTAGLNVNTGALPSAPVAGDIAMNSAGNLNWYDGTAWRLGSIADSVLTAGAPLIGNGTNHLTTGSVTGSGSFVLSTAPIIANPVITTFVNSNHDHSNAANGGAVAFSGDVGGTNQASTISANAVTSSKMAVVNTRRVCSIVIGADNGLALANADLGPQGRQCYIPYAATVVEVIVAADGGTPNAVPSRNHAGTRAHLTSSALATAASGGLACSNTAGTAGLDGVTACSATLQNTSLSAGDWIDLDSGATAGGTAKRMSIDITYVVN